MAKVYDLNNYRKKKESKPYIEEILNYHSATSQAERRKRIKESERKLKESLNRIAKLMNELPPSRRF